MSVQLFEQAAEAYALVAAGFDESKHPRNPAGKRDGVRSPKDGGKFASKKGAAAEATDDVDAVVDEILKQGVDTQTFYEGPEYTDARRAEHDAIVLKALRDGKPVEGRAKTLFLAGGSGAGKSTILFDELGGGPADSVMVNPDMFKEALPEYRRLGERGNPLAASVAHEESSDLAARTLLEANAMNSNVVVDGTGDSGPGKFLGKINDARKIGRDVEVVIVDLPTDVAVARAYQRAAEDPYGRMVPEQVIRDYHQSVTARHLEWRDQVDDWQAWANDDADAGGRRLIARRVDGGPIEVLDEARYEQMLAKANE